MIATPHRSLLSIWLLGFPGLFLGLLRISLFTSVWLLQELCNSQNVIIIITVKNCGNCDWVTALQHTHLNFWFFFNLVLVFLQRFLQSLHLLGLFALPSLLLPPFTTLLIAETFALQLPPSSLFLLFLPDSLKGINRTRDMTWQSCNSTPANWNGTLLYLLTCLFFRKSSSGVVFLALKKEKTLHYAPESSKSDLKCVHSCVRCACSLKRA